MNCLLSHRIHYILAISLLPLQPILAQEDVPTERMSCTSILVGREASADGSVMTSHTCDSWYRTWMTMTPARDYERDTITAIYDGRMHTQAATDSTKLYRRGIIPQVRHTYRYLDTAYPCLNEKQVAMGETTIGGRDTLRNKKALHHCARGYCTDGQPGRAVWLWRQRRVPHRGRPTRGVDF